MADFILPTVKIEKDKRLLLIFMLDILCNIR